MRTSYIGTPCINHIIYYVMYIDYIHFAVVMKDDRIAKNWKILHILWQPLLNYRERYYSYMIY